MDQFICFATLATGTKVKLTQQDYEKFNEIDNDDFLEAGGKTFKKSAVMEIQGIEEWVDESYNYGQPYSSLPIGYGFERIIGREKRLKGIEAMARGLKRAKEEFKGQPTPNINELLKLARERYSYVKNGLEPTNHLKI